MSAADPVGLLSRVSLFSELSREELERISRVAVPRSFPAGVRVFHEGDRSDACYLVRSGDLRVKPRAPRRPGDRARHAGLGGHLRGARDARRRGSLGKRRDALGLHCWRSPAADFRRMLAEHLGDLREADHRANAAAAGDERAGRPAVVPDGAEPRGDAIPGGSDIDFLALVTREPQPIDLQHLAAEESTLARTQQASARVDLEAERFDALRRFASSSSLATRCAYLVPYGPEDIGAIYRQVAAFAPARRVLADELFGLYGNPVAEKTTILRVLDEAAEKLA